MSEAQESQPQTSRREWISFGILALILLGTIVVVALTRPLIFGWIVPAVLADPNGAAVTPAEPVEEAPAVEEAEEAVPAEEAEAPVEEAVEGSGDPEADDPNAGGGAPAGEGEAAVEEPTSEEAPAEEAAQPEEAAGEATVEEDEAGDGSEAGNGETAVSNENSIPHTVQPGENLTNIANTYGISVEQILAANNIPNPNRISAGTVLNIPQP